MSDIVTSGTDPDVTYVYLGNRLIAELEEQVQPRPEAEIHGWGFGYSDNKYDYTTTFTLANAASIEFCVDGYAINNAAEVSVTINGHLIGYLEPGSSPTQTCFNVGADVLNDGSNTVVFTQATPGQTWGVGIPSFELIGAKVIPAIITLLLDDVTKYSLTSTFNLSDAVDNIAKVELCIEGYAMDSEINVSVTINGSFIGNLMLDHTSSETCFTVDADFLNDGNNIIEYAQTNQGVNWDITTITIKPIGHSVMPFIMLLLNGEEKDK